MKKIYFPDMDKLHQIQYLVGGDNTYRYLLVKAIESLIVDGINYPNKGILKSAYKYIKENPDIVHSICLLYPEELAYTEIGKYDAELCSILISQNTDKSICALDNLANFSESVNFNIGIVNKTVNTLQQKLTDYPQYRFTYQESPLLRSIFSVDSQKFDNCDNDVVIGLTTIEPAYAISFNRQRYLNEQQRQNSLLDGIRKLSLRYNISQTCGSEYRSKDILTNQDQEVKRLIKTIKHDKSNLY